MFLQTLHSNAFRHLHVGILKGKGKAVFLPELFHLLPYSTEEKQSCLLVLSKLRNEHPLTISSSSIFLPKSQFCPMCRKTLFPCLLKSISHECVCVWWSCMCVCTPPCVHCICMHICMHTCMCMRKSKIDIRCLSLLH